MYNKIYGRQIAASTLFFLEKYGNRCSDKYVAYILDAAATTPGSGFSDKGMVQLTNHDYLIARRAFFYDLAPYTGEIACDDPAGKVGLDASTMRKIFQKRYDRAKGEIGMNMGFPPWWSKYNKDYNKGQLDDGQLEAYFAELVTCYNLAKEADAADLAEMTNGSVYYKYVPTLEKFENTKPATDMKYDNNKYTFHHFFLLKLISVPLLWKNLLFHHVQPCLMVSNPLYHH